ncbi:hypothetical protein Glove_172g39 [Diversispora epigaea]|uniref:Uncharacterized protein n=1 Tax=Diversispora epigaea TaxID=1348612 RepID=A0A397IPH0_9GLOM|nr:hypothetical protein Glove_172g39 [Diversispora epigaea]
MPQTPPPSYEFNLVPIVIISPKKHLIITESNSSSSFDANTISSRGYRDAIKTTKKKTTSFNLKNNEESSPFTSLKNKNNNNEDNNNSNNNHNNNNNNNNNI